MTTKTMMDGDCEGKSSKIIKRLDAHREIVLK